MSLRYLLLIVLFACTPPKPSQTPKKTSEKEKPLAAKTFSLHDLKKGEIHEGFRAEAVYLNDAQIPFGARFVHEHSGFVLDFLQIQSVPQAFLWVNSFPTSDMGEPHTQEHLLLGKGNVGRAVSGVKSMSLASSSAFTQQWRTAYHFNTLAGPKVFFELFSQQLNALLHPDYTDEEIRREVRHWGVSEDPSDNRLRLEEKGTVYQEMLSSFSRPIRQVFRKTNQVLYGKVHPFSYSSGGLPSAIREMKAEDIREFHKNNYQLGNMGMVASFPKEIFVQDVLQNLDQIFRTLSKEKTNLQFTSLKDVPTPKSAPEGTIEIFEYAYENEQQPGWVLFAWPANRSLGVKDTVLIELFLSALAGDASTNLYKLFVDTETRKVETGAKGVAAFLDDELLVGNPVYVGLRDVDPGAMNEKTLSLVRKMILEEIKRLASMKDNSKKLLEFNARIKSRVLSNRRSLIKFVDSPPRFGFRGSGSGWLTHLDMLNRKEGFQKSVTLKDELMEVESLLESGKNIWASYLKQWKLLDETLYIVAGKPNASLLAKQEAERVARADKEIERLKKLYKVSDTQEALRLYQADYVKTTKELEQLAENTSAKRFIETPPLTLDDSLDFEQSTVQEHAPLVSSFFDTLTSATTGIALGLDSVPEDRLVYLSMLPALLTQVGVIKDGVPVSFEEMNEMLRREILSLNAYLSTNYRTGRAELVVRGAGNDISESKKALEWIKLVLESPDWRPENLSRIRDVVDQNLSFLRNRMMGSEESWVNNPSTAYIFQQNPLMLATSSFLTQTHFALRLRWMLTAPENLKDQKALQKYLDEFSKAASFGTHEELQILLDKIQGEEDKAVRVSKRLKSYLKNFEKLSETSKEIVNEAAVDLGKNLPALPKETLAKDWSYLVNQIRHDLLLSPEDVLLQLDSLRKNLQSTQNARLFFIGSREAKKTLQPKINEILSSFSTDPLPSASYQKDRLIDKRLSSRLASGETPVFVALLSPNVQGGVFLNSASSAQYQDTESEKLLDYLASLLYAGAGSHGIFLKTWGAGLAYSNGLRGSPATGRIGYYAERTPDLPETLKFVIKEIKKAKPDPSLAEYVIALAFNPSRTASSYESRGESIAADLADGQTPEIVKAFRQKLLLLRKDPALSDKLFARKDAIYEKVLPGYGKKAKEVSGGVYYVIGPEKQLESYEEYLQSVEGKDTRLYRLYPRDYWITLSEKSLQKP